MQKMMRIMSGGGSRKMMRQAEAMNAKGIYSRSKRAR
jgi:hypothetical protein